VTQQPKNISLQGAGAVAQAVGKLYPQLSKSHRKTADYVLGNPFRAATMTIDELSEAAGISVATANRFAHALGFDGYASFRAALVSILRPPWPRWKTARRSSVPPPVPRSWPPP
jgi:DNA-binding MurR/RpiR family transcriptional regulator